MPFVATLIPASPTIPPMLLNQLLLNAEEQGIEPTSIDWLEPGRVVDMYFSEALPDEWMRMCKEMCAAYTADIIFQPIATRDKKMLISDMDSTMITVECIDELADYVGKKDHVARITERAMNGELDFTQALNERVGLLAGLPEETLEACLNERIKLMPGSPELLAVMKREGAFCLLVSGGFDFFTSRVAAALGFDADVSNKLEITDGKLTGKVIPPIMDKDGKVAALNKYTAEHSIDVSQVLAVGDGANDLPMLLASGLGIAYHAKPSVREQVLNSVDYNDLTALIYMQGYEFRP